MKAPSTVPSALRSALDPPVEKVDVFGVCNKDVLLVGAEGSANSIEEEVALGEAAAGVQEVLLDDELLLGWEGLEWRRDLELASVAGRPCHLARHATEATTDQLHATEVARGHKGGDEEQD